MEKMERKRDTGKTRKKPERKKRRASGEARGRGHNGTE